MVIGNLDVTYPKKGETITIDNGTLSIKTGTVDAEGTCNTTSATQISGAKATIDPPTDGKGPTLTIKDINDTGNTLAAIGGTECSVSVDAEKKTLTIKYKDTNQEDKCITITLTSTDITKAANDTTVQYGHIFTEGFDTSTVHPEIISPTLMVIVDIMKSQQIYDPYVWMGNWGGSHDPVEANGDLTLKSTSGDYSSKSSTHTITLTITGAAYKNDKVTTEKILGLSSSGNTLVLTSGTPINQSGTYNLTRGSLTLKLNRAHPKFTAGTYNVSLNIERDIDLGTSCTNCKLKPSDKPVTLGTYSISGTSTTFTGDPETDADHSKHSTNKCCMYSKQNTWSTKSGNNRYGWHLFTILIPLKII